MLHNSRTLLQRLMNLTGGFSATPATTHRRGAGDRVARGRFDGGLRTADRLAERN
ncbi:hypothetical protein M8494_04995 [Serratia ureilytica]